MENIIEMNYKKQPQTLQISCGDKAFDTTRIADLPLEQWISPFFTKGIRWRGLYEELKIFTGNESFTLRFDGDDDSFALVKHALAGMPVKLIGMNNTVTIVYSEDPITTKIVINGHIFDTALLQNRYIDEWLKPFQIRETRWNGIFKEIERFIGTDVYTLYFVGEQKFMNLLIDNCPENIDIFYRNPQILNQATKTKLPERAASDTDPNPVPKINMERISIVANKTIKTIKQNVESTDHDVDTDELPIKNSFIRNNIMTICSVCAIVLLFLPFANYSAVASMEDRLMQTDVVRVSGFEAMFGVKEITVGLNHSVFAFLLLIVPVLIAGLNYIKQLKPFRKWIAVGAPLLGIIAEIITLFDVGKLFNLRGLPGEAKLKTSPGIGFFLILVVYILMIVVGLILHHGMKVPKKKQEL